MHLSSESLARYKVDCMDYGKLEYLTHADRRTRLVQGGINGREAGTLWQKSHWGPHNCAGETNTKDSVVHAKSLYGPVSPDS